SRTGRSCSRGPSTCATCWAADPRLIGSATARQRPIGGAPKAARYASSMAQPRTPTASDDARPPRPTRTTRSKPSGPRRTAAPSTAGTAAGPDLEALRSQLLETVAKHYPQADLTPVSGAFDLA